MAAASGDSALALFSGELKLARAGQGMSQEQLGDKISYSPSMVAMVETGRRIPSLDFAKRCDEALETGGRLMRIWPVVRREGHPSWFRPYVELEASAVSLRSWEPLVIPGLLQTPDYARQIYREGRPTDSDEEIDRFVAARMERQEILAGENGPVLWCVIDEGVIRRPVGGPECMRAQMNKLLKASDRPKTMIQVVPLAAGAHGGLTGSFMIAEFADGPDIVYVDTILAGQLVESPAEVSKIGLVYDALRADALSRRDSLRLLEEVAKTWT